MGDLLVEPGDTIGILGSGQLGRMLAMAAARLGIRSHIYCPESGPAFDVAAAHTKADYDDDAALAAFAAQVKVVTYEFENVPSHTAEFLSDHGHVHPNARALAIAQDRLSEKRFLNGLGIPTAPFLDVDDAEGLARAVTQLGRPSILKTRRFGYDGKGQVMIREGSDLAVVFRSLGGVMGVASFGAVLTARLTDGLTQADLPGGLDGASLMRGGIVQIMALPAEAQRIVVEIYRHSIAMTFAMGIAITAVACVFLLFLPELELKSRHLKSNETPGRALSNQQSRTT